MRRMILAVLVLAGCGGSAEVVADTLPVADTTATTVAAITPTAPATTTTPAGTLSLKAIAAMRSCVEGAAVIQPTLDFPTVADSYVGGVLDNCTVASDLASADMPGTLISVLMSFINVELRRLDYDASVGQLPLSSDSAWTEFYNGWVEDLTEALDSVS